MPRVRYLRDGSLLPDGALLVCPENPSADDDVTILVHPDHMSQRLADLLGDLRIIFTVRDA